MTDIAAARWPGIAHTPQTPFKARVARTILRPAVTRTPVRLTFPDGTVWGHGGPDSPEMAVVRPAAFFRRLGADSKIGFGEAYMAGDWTAGPGTDLADLLTPFAERLTHLVPKPLQRLRVFVDKKLPHHEKNSIEGSRSNIERHYDLSNEMFATFLDPTMSYSSAWFASTDDEPLETAQLRKIDGILDQAHVGEGTRVLEIGTGWGALAIRAAQRGAHVTTITISQEQAALAQQRIDAAGLTDRVDLRLQDYREVQGQFDAIVSVEMIEAVGEEYWPTYFAAIDRLLAPGGSVSIQAITMAHHRYLATRNSYGWIQKYIFPGGLIPSLDAIDSTLAEHTTLKVTERRSLGQDYARTLHLWREQFLANWAGVQAQGFDETFRRMWEFYLAYCEAGFRVGYIDVFQLQMSRP
ncbi:Cyclopropane-fatty-acyl-phospholipid synthase [Aeromicrobium marinum DSM 15272]|uniref:Cyclopropane-fatty-acyl-phospholipid synthase n=1 Tax=Aeromicrobium marinum DSM 15272 TaxID=585531 RepID=E2SAU8_9ACTN|nr:cyclopropane-fatty-acyl-phospholipid synthase family protein [Aeromicrobium marinum]EFQ83494.1 Cyclopropane-fatty-acyl-phospholipid synthase [Aeromicrobium marinum DSM 15272]